MNRFDQALIYYKDALATKCPNQETLLEKVKSCIYECETKAKRIFHISYKNNANIGATAEFPIRPQTANGMQRKSIYYH